MQETQLILARFQTDFVQLTFQALSLLGLSMLAFLIVRVLLAGATPASARLQRAWLALALSVIRTSAVIGVLWLSLLALAWPELLARVGSVIAPMLALVVVLLVIGETTLFRWLQSKIHREEGIQTVQRLAIVLLGCMYASVMVLVAIVQSWMRRPTGAELIDGRYLVTDWRSVILGAQPLLQISLTGLSAVILASAIAMYCARSDAPDSRWQWSISSWTYRVIGLLGLISLAAAYWPMNQVAAWWLAQPSQFASALWALLSGSNAELHAGLSPAMGNSVPVFAWLVAAFWLLAVIGFVRCMWRQSLASPWFVVFALCFWLAAWWFMHASVGPDLVAGLPQADLVSSQPTSVLWVGSWMVVLVCLVALGLIWHSAKSAFGVDSAQVTGQDGGSVRP
jgi:hypothetical protein